MLTPFIETMDVHKILKVLKLMSLQLNLHGFFEIVFVASGCVGGILVLDGKT